jgi:uncharacterized protein (TIGR02266 family)
VMESYAIVFPIRFAWEGQAVQTTTQRLARDGVFIRCLSSPPVGSSIRMKLYLPGEPLAEELDGTVREASTAAKDSGFWVEFTRVSEAAQSRIGALLERKERASSSTPIGALTLQPAPADDPRRTFPRYPARFAVRLSNVQDFVLEYAANISAGGVFVETAVPPEMDAVIGISMELPGGGAPVEAKAVVVHRVTTAEAKARGVPAGVGVQFVGADDKFRERIDKAIETILKRGP